MEQPEASGSTDSPTIIRRRRFYNACDMCKQRKRDSCEKPTNICSNCIASGVECTHEVVKKKLKEQRVNEKPISLRIDDILCAPKSYIPPREPSIARKLITELASYARSLEIRLAQLGEPSTSSDSSQLSQTTRSDVLEEGSEDTSDDEHPDTLLESFQNISIYPPNKRFYGRSSGAMLLQTTWEAKHQTRNDKESSDGEFGDTDWQRFEHRTAQGFSPNHATCSLQYPEHDLILHLSDMYFQYNALTASFIHRPSFERLIHQGFYLHDRSFGHLVLSVCACSSRYSTDPRVLAELEYPHKKRQVGWKWYSQLESAVMTISEPQTSSPYELQTLCNCIWFLLPEPTSASALTWLLIGKGITLAQEIGIHRRQWYIDNSESRSRVELEQWKRSFWSLATSDILVSGFLGRPSATSPDEHDLDYPVECDDEFWEHSDPNQAFQQPQDKPSRTTFWVTLLKLLRIYSYAQRTIYGVKRPELLSSASNSWRKDALIKIDTQLNDWNRSVANYLKWDPQESIPKEPQFHHQCAALYSFYYCIKIQAYRYFIPSPSSKPSDISYSSLDVCVDTAHACIQMLDISSQSNFTPVPPVLHSLLSSAVIFLVKIWRCMKYTPESIFYPEVNNVYTCIEISQRLEQRTPVAGRLRDILEALISTNKLPASILIPPSTNQSTNLNAPTNDSAALTSTIDSNILGLHEPSTFNIQGNPVQDRVDMSVYNAIDMSTNATISGDALPQSEGYNDEFESMLVDFLLAPPTMQDTWNAFSSRYEQARNLK